MDHERLGEAAKSAFEGTAVAFAYLFGSSARGTARPHSDVDVAVYLDSQPYDALGASLELVRRLSAAGVDGSEVIVLNDAPLPLRGRAISEGKVVYSRDEPRRVRYESVTMRQFLDYKIHADALDVVFLRDIAEGRR